jgi:signal transduction histidine kinase
MERQERFAAAASHELRTPLTVLQGTLEVALLRRRTPEEYERMLGQAVAQSQRMGALIADLLALARVQRDADTLALELLDLREIAGAAAAEVRPLAAGKGQTLEVALGTALPVLGDRLKLRQAIANLLDNAVTYTPQGGVIQLAGRREHGRAVLEVRDTGPGIAAEHLPRLFEPFYRASRARPAEGGHAGLGLALAAWIVRVHHGGLSVQSEVGAGTAFTLSLPVARAALPAAREA